MCLLTLYCRGLKSQGGSSGNVEKHFGLEKTRITVIITMDNRAKTVLLKKITKLSKYLLTFNKRGHHIYCNAQKIVIDSSQGITRQCSYK